MAKFYDTNAILDLGEAVLEDEKFYFSSISLIELENIKTNRNKSDEVKYKARRIMRILDENEDSYEVIVYDSWCAEELEKASLDDTPDNKICTCYLKLKSYFEWNELDFNIEFVTGDICCRAIAREHLGINTTRINSTEEEVYRGYVDKSLSEEEMAYFYEHLSENTYGLLTNEYIILKNENNETVDKLKWNGEEHITVSPIPFKSSMFGTLKPLDEIQACAMDSIEVNDITVLYGKAGSGKTTLPLNYIMQGLEKGHFKKLYVIYSYEPLKGAKTLGFEKGDHITKLLYSASIGNILASKFGDISQVEYMIDSGLLDIIPTANIRGVEFEKDSVVLCTESQNLDVYTLKTIIQRCKEGCKQIYEGDIIEQKDTNIQNIGINRLIDVFKGHKSFGCVKLKNNYRSPLSELADLM